jgi:hypothetical protein
VLNHLDLQLVRSGLAGFEAYDSSGGLLCCWAFDPAGCRLEAEDVGAFTDHGPLDELGELLGSEPDREREPEIGVLQPCFCQAAGSRGGMVVEDPFLKPGIGAAKRFQASSPVVASSSRGSGCSSSLPGPVRWEVSLSRGQPRLMW